MRDKKVLNRRQIVLAMAFFLGLAVLLAPSLGGAQAKRTINVGYMPVFTVLPLYTGIERGYFADRGIKIKLKRVIFPRMIATMISGDTDLSSHSVYVTLAARTQGIAIRIVAPAAFVGTKRPGGNAIMVRKDSGINSLKKLAGKSMGIVQLRSIAHVMTGEVLERAGVDIGTITWIEVPVFQLPKVLLSRQLNAVHVFEPFLTVLKNSGEVKILSYNDIETIPGAPMAALTGMEKWLKKNRSLVDSFRRAHARAVDYVNGNEAYARQVLVKYTRTKPDLAEKVTLAEFRNVITTKELELQQELAVKYGTVRKRINVKDVLYENMK